MFWVFLDAKDLRIRFCQSGVSQISFLFSCLSLLCQSHVSLISLSCLSHVFLMSFSCFSHVSLMSLSTLFQLSFKSCLFHGSFVARSWLFHWSFMTLLWLFHGSFMALSWLSHGWTLEAVSTMALVTQVYHQTSWHNSKINYLAVGHCFHLYESSKI